MSLPSRTFRASAGLLLAPAAFVLLLAACGADGESTVRTDSGAPFCDEERDRFYQGEECDDCEVWSHRHVQQVVSTMPEELLRCDAPEDSCTAILLRKSPCWNRGMWFGCTEVVVNAAQQDAFHAHDAEVAEQTCLSPGSTWQGCGETLGLKWTCGHFPEPACLQGVCVDTMNTDVPHVQRTGGGGRHP